MRRLTTALVFVSAAAWAQAPDQEKPASDFSVVGVHHAWYVVPTGADFELSSGPWKLALGAGVDQPHFGRNLDTGDLRPETDPYLKPLLPIGHAGLFYTVSTDWVDAWAGPSVVGYRMLESSSSAFPDWSGNVYWALEAGLKRERVSYNPHGLESGYSARLEASWSPPLLSLKGTDYYQLTARSAWYFPLWDMPSDLQFFSGLLALRADAEYTSGSQVPIIKLDPSEVRGYDNTFDAKMLTTASAEFRMRLPALGTWFPGLWKGGELVPIGFGFVDAGTYSGFADASVTNKSGVLVGAGIGAGLEIAHYATPTLTVAMPLTGVKKTIWWDLGFQLAF